MSAQDPNVVGPTLAAQLLGVSTTTVHRWKAGQKLRSAASTARVGIACASQMSSP